jgi:hypothetical protein
MKREFPEQNSVNIWGVTSPKGGIATVKTTLVFEDKSYSKGLVLHNEDLENEKRLQKKLANLGNAIERAINYYI